MTSPAAATSLAGTTLVATLTPPTVRLTPGAEARCVVTVHNRDDIVEGYRLEVMGDPAAWATVTPERIQVYPGTDGTAEIVFRLPRSAKVHDPEVPFAVRVLPVERPENVAVPEGTVRIAELTDLVGELLPQTSRTRRATLHDVAVDNLGNAPADVHLSVSDPDNALKLVPRPARLTVGPGQAMVARVSVRHRRLLWRGQPVARRFQITATTADGPAVSLDGTSVQQPVLGRWVVAAVAALLALALIGAGLWFGLLRPAVKSEASRAGKAAAQREPKSAGLASQEAVQEAPAAAAAPTEAEAAAATGQAPTVAGAKQPVLTPANYRGRVFDGTDATSTTVELRKALPNRFTLSFILVGAPQGDTGILEILIGNDVWQVHNLANVRDFDLHPTPAIEVPANTAIRVRMRCTAVGPLPIPEANNRCFVNVVISGTEVKPAT